jgi:predicted alpha/beta hydrolase family esterase
MAKRILFIHSAGPQESDRGSMKLIQYLRLEKDSGYRIIAPDMPTPTRPVYGPWKRELEKHLEFIDDDVILIGHSLGASLLLKYFSEMPYQKPIAGLFLVAAPFWGFDNNWHLPDFTLMPNFGQRLVSIPKIFFYHSKDDEIVPVTHLYRFADQVTFATCRELDHGGHLFHVGIPQLSRDILDL